MSNKKGDPQILLKPLPKPLPNIIFRKKNILFLDTKQKTIKPMYKEDIIYQSQLGDFLHLTDPAEKITIFNRLNLKTMKSHTVAQCTQSGKVVWEKTSEYIAGIIGHDKYDIVFSSLCSVISQEFKIRAILALLSEPKKAKETQSQLCQSDLSQIKIMIDNEVQTTESWIDTIKKPPLKRMKRQVTPYVVTEDNDPEPVSKMIIYPKDFDSFAQAETVKSEKIDSENDSQIPILNSDQDTEPLSVLKFDENSSDSIGNLSSLSITTTPELMKAPLSLVDQVTEPVKDYSSVTMLDGTVLTIPCKIEDDFHVATPEILRLVSPEHRRMLLWYQAYTDWKYCLTRDNDDNLPIHLAVLNDDIHLLRRHCLVLKTRNESVDVTNGDNMTALQISILASSPECTSLLMQQGANPLVTDEEYRTCFHLAAEAGAPHLEALIKRCKEDPLSILRSSDELWKPELALKPKDYQVKYLLLKVCSTFDSQGYTPLMLASKLGKHEAVQTLVTAAPPSVDRRAPSSGATALYLAVSAACTDSAQRGNKSKVSDDFKKTIEHILDAGADPNKDTFSGSDINALLTDFSNSELSMILALKRSAVNCRDIDTKDNQPFMLIKERDGTVMNLKDQIQKTKEITKIKEEIKKEAANKEKKTKKDKPVILENKVITKPSDEFINTYRNFVHKLKNPDFIRCYNKLNRKTKVSKDDEIPSTSKSTPESNALKVKLLKKTNKEKAKPTNIKNCTVPKPIVVIKKEDQLAINTNDIKTEESESGSEDSIILSLLRSEKRKIVTPTEVPVPPLVLIAPKSQKDEPTSPKRIKIEEDA